MREKFFKAWNKKDNEWLQICNEEIRDQYDLSFADRVAYKFGPENYILQQIEFKDLDIIQDTGLEDINGQKIYEGYILKNKFGLLWTVDYDEDYARYYIYYMNKNNKMWITKKTVKNSKLEIVGNIFENSNLL